MQELELVSPEKISSTEYIFMIPEEDNLDNCRLCSYDTLAHSSKQYLYYDSGRLRIGAQQSRYNLQTIETIVIHK